MDLHYKYDGTSSTDYNVKVEVVNLDDKTEKEQLTYMAVGNTKPDIDLIAGYISDIDYTNVGLNFEELNDILSINIEIPSSLDSVDDLLSPLPSFDEFETPPADKKSYDEKKEHMKAIKQQVRESAKERQQNEEAYITLSFSSYNAKDDFCDLLGISTDDKFAKGEDVLRLIK